MTASVLCILKITGDILSKSIGVVDSYFDLYIQGFSNGCRIPTPVASKGGKSQGNEVNQRLKGEFKTKEEQCDAIEK